MSGGGSSVRGKHTAGSRVSKKKRQMEKFPSPCAGYGNGFSQQEGRNALHWVWLEALGGGVHRILPPGGVIQRFIECLIRVVGGDRAHLSNVMMVIEFSEASNRQSCRCRYRDGGSHRLVGIVLKLYYMGEILAESLTIAFWCKSYGKCPLTTGEQSYAKVVYTSNNLQSVYGRHRQPGGPSGTAGPSP
jgi:hypothetical protein